MKNKTITIYELMGLIKDGKAPKRIKIISITFEFNNDFYSLENMYKDKSGRTWFEDINLTLENEVEILPEENDEWEDIEYLYFDNVAPKPATENEAYLASYLLEYEYVINKLIKNQEYLKERIEKDDLR